ncbi:hypothetical protein NXT08_04825 [Rhodococcus pyridinivorans]|uniref:hypothetical protein n=1 Tax=Rhodococcus pyridinivorans TaxID=103816 RepID=UPI002164B47A|nr:hypothetical protein [Rhodococcus pyridinivorans]UVT25957.1 hypothetical protein NXT08_04825 [Rhodococcus pyridinivorans]
MFVDTAATHMARDAAFDYRPDATDRAETLFDRVVAQIRDKNDDISVFSAASPARVPDARCFEVTTPYSEGGKLYAAPRHLRRRDPHQDPARRAPGDRGRST